MAKVKVIIPNFGGLADAEKGIGELVHNKDHYFEIISSRCCDSARARNTGVSLSYKAKQTREEIGDWNYFLFVDPDMAFSGDNVLTLISRKKPIISAAYIMRHKPSFYNAGIWDNNIGGKIVKNFPVGSKGQHLVHFTGGGLLLVEAEAFLKIDYPWFRHRIATLGDYSVLISNDYGFCIGATLAGVEVWVDCDTEVKHNLNRKFTVKEE